MNLKNNDKVLIKKTYLGGFEETFEATIKQDDYCIKDEFYYEVINSTNPNNSYGSIYDNGIEILKIIL